MFNAHNKDVNVKVHCAKHLQHYALQ